MSWGSPEEEAVFSETHFGEDGMKKIRAKEGVRASGPHSPVRADGPNSVWWPGDLAHLDWSGQPWGGVELGRWTGITKGENCWFWGRLRGG